MARWKPDARGRLEQAAMELFIERGYARTTVSDIAERAGLTERTFFRYFADKREVLFSGSKDLEDRLVELVKNAPVDAALLDVVAHAFEQVAAALQNQRDFSYVRARYAILSEHAEVRERELIKMASMTAAITHALRERGVAEPTASLVAEVGMGAFRIGFEQWVNGNKPHDFAAHIRAAVRALKALALATPPVRKRVGRAAGRAK